MLTLFSLLEKACEQQERSLNQKNHYQRTHFLVKCNQPFFADVNKRISEHAMKLTLEQYQKSLAPEVEPCGDLFTNTMGIPCSHRIRQIMGNDLILNVNHFDQYWWLDQPQGVVTVPNDENIDMDTLISHIRQHNDLLMPHQRKIYFSSIRNIFNRDLEVQNPVLAPTRGRTTESTRRNPSAFEYVQESTIQQPQQQSNQSRTLQRISRCRLCNISGHNHGHVP